LKDVQTLFHVGAAGGLTDGQLLERFVAGDASTSEAAFAALVERHGPMVLRTCRQVVGDPHDALDASQATFLVLTRKAASVRARDSVAGWLHGVARRVALRARRDAARRRAHEHNAARDRPQTHAPAADASPEDLSILHEELARLPARFREPIVLCHLEGLTAEAAAERLGCPRGTVLSRLSRGRKRLLHRLLRRGLAPAAGLAAAGLSARSETALLGALTARAAGQATSAAADSARVLTLAEGALKTMTAATRTAVSLAAFAGIVLAAGAGLRIWGQTRPAKPPAPLAAQQTKATRPAPPAPVLPDAALRRLGSFVGNGTLTNPATSRLREILKLTDEQVAALQTLATRDEKRIAAYKQLSVFLLPRARAEAGDAIDASIDKETGQALVAALRPEQLKLLEQVVLASHGVRAFTFPDVQDALKLTPDQRTRVKALIDDLFARLKTLQNGPGGRPTDTAAALKLQGAIDPLYQDAYEKALKVLTPEQSDAWRARLGDPFGVNAPKPDPAPR